jgi:hypothetical protein
MKIANDVNAALLAAIVAMLGLGLAAPAAATTLTFDSFAHDQSERLTGEYTGNFTYQAFVEQGFIVSIIPSPWIIWGRNDPRNADQGGATLTNLDGRARTAVQAVGLGPFTLNSFQVASFYNGSNEDGFGNSFTLRFNGDISTDQTFAIDRLPGFQTFTINRSGIFAFEIRNAYLQLDNVVLNASMGAPGVPEPASWAMLIAGFGLTGAAMRRRRVAAA